MNCVEKYLHKNDTSLRKLASLCELDVNRIRRPLAGFGVGLLETALQIEIKTNGEIKAHDFLCDSYDAFAQEQNRHTS